jgi:predicted permease
MNMSNQKNGNLDIKKHGRLSEFMSDFPLLHLGLGLVGNISFVAGSIMFFYDSLKMPAIWLFTIGSSGMLIGSLGQLFVKIVEHRKKKDNWIVILQIAYLILMSGEYAVLNPQSFHPDLSVRNWIYKSPS